MARPRFSLLDFACIVAAVPIWVFLLILTSGGTGFGTGQFRFIVAPLVLGGMTVAMQRLVRSWALSALLSGLIALGVLRIAFWLANTQ
jgi:hypothetical protein